MRPRLAALLLALASGALACATPSPSAPNPVDLSSGAEQLCALRQGRVSCWGQGWSGSPEDPTPASLPGLEGATALATGSLHACALHQGRVSCWGSNELGQLGQGAPSSGDVREPKVVALPGAAKALAASHHMSCALTEGGELWCWGLLEGFHPISGVQTFFSSAEPVRLGQVQGVSLAMVGAPCVLTAQGEVFCWREEQTPFVALRRDQVARPPQALARLFGGARLCGSTPAGALLCLREPAWSLEVQAVRDFASGAAGQYWLDQKGQLRCQGQVEVPQGEGFQRVAVGLGYVCALDGRGAPRCWGDVPW